MGRFYLRWPYTSPLEGDSSPIPAWSFVLRRSCTSTLARRTDNVSEAAFKLKPLEAPPYREPPHNIEAEQALLGAMLINNDAFHRVADFLKANHFFEPLHGTIFELTSELIRS